MTRPEPDHLGAEHELEPCPHDPTDRLHAVCEALAHPARRRVLSALRQHGGEIAAGALARHFAHAWSTTTRHLRVLEQAGLIEQRRIGRARLYRLTRAPFAELVGWLGRFDDAG
jgi:DNA-binding transcriptional ArsR family regulator